MIVMIGDLVKSRSIRQRKKIARQIEATLAEVNRRFEDQWRAPLVTTRGIDELSGVLRGLGSAFDVAVAINESIWPHRFRFAVASGAIDVAADSKNAADMDGPAFHRATAALERARSEGLPFTLGVQSLQKEMRAMAESLAMLHDALAADWTQAQAQAVSAYRQTGTQTAAAEELGVRQQTVSKQLARARHSERSLAESALRGWLSVLGKNLEEESR